MAIYPSILPTWDTNETNTTQPDPTRQADGWVYTAGKPQKPFADYENWMKNNTYKWLSYFNTRQQTLTHNMSSDADYTLSDAENGYGRYVITDSGVVLTTTRAIELDTVQRDFIAVNETAQTITFKTVSGTGIDVGAGQSLPLYVDGTNVISSGALEFSSQAENEAGTVEGKAVDPKGIREAFNATGTAPVYACRAWCNFDGTGTDPITPNGAGNISSITKSSTGVYVINFTTSMPSTNYSIMGTAGFNGSAPQYVHEVPSSRTVNSITINTRNSAGAINDSDSININIFI